MPLANHWWDSRPLRGWGLWKRRSVHRILCRNALQSPEACHLHYSLRISLLTAALRLQCQQAASRLQCQQAASRLQRAGSKGVQPSVSTSTVLRFCSGSKGPSYLTGRHVRQGERPEKTSVGSLFHGSFCQVRWCGQILLQTGVCVRRCAFGSPLSRPQRA